MYYFILRARSARGSSFSVVAFRRRRRSFVRLFFSVFFPFPKGRNFSQKSEAEEDFERRFCCCFDVEHLERGRAVDEVCGRGRVFPVLWSFKLRPVVASGGPGGVRSSARARDARGHDRHRESEADPGTFARMLSPGRREPLRELQRAGGKVRGGVPREKLGQNKRHERLQVTTTTLTSTTTTPSLLTRERIRNVVVVYLLLLLLSVEEEKDTTKEEGRPLLLVASSSSSSFDDDDKNDDDDTKRPRPLLLLLFVWFLAFRNNTRLS